MKRIRFEFCISNCRWQNCNEPIEYGIDYAGLYLRRRLARSRMAACPQVRMRAIMAAARLLGSLRAVGSLLNSAWLTASI